MKIRNSVYGLILFFSLCLILSILLSCEGRKSSEQESKTNSPPAVTSVTIQPEKAYKGNELNLAIESNDPDRDLVTYRYQWIKNDQEILGENNISLKGDRFQKGDRIQVRVIPSDGKMEGPPFLSSQIRILNSPPVIQEVWIEPQSAFVSESLQANARSLDSDGDFVYYTFQWEKNAQVMPDETSQVLDRTRFKKRDSIAVSVIPDDRETEGARKRSVPVVVLNSPPTITSSPPTSVTGTTYQYQVAPFDADQDPIIFALKAGPKGMVLDQRTGLLRWEFRKEDKGTQPVEIEVADNEGAKSTQRFTLIIDFK